MHLLIDERKHAYPDALPEPGGTVDQSVPVLGTTEFTPAVDGGRHYYIRTTTDIRFAVAAADYDPDDFSAEALLQPFEVRCIFLGDDKGTYRTLFMKAVGADAVVTVEKLR